MINISRGWRVPRSVVSPSSDLVERFMRLKAAMSASAKPFTGKDELPVNPDYFYYLFGADEDMSRALKGKPSGTSLQVMCLADGTPVYELKFPAEPA